MQVLEVINPGITTTIQDLGRYGYQRYGLPVSGAMDVFSLRVANGLVGNDEREAGLEITAVGASFRFLSDAVIAITGGDLNPHINNQAVSMWHPIVIEAGSRLDFIESRAGFRAYVAIHGGIDVPLVLGSRSTDVRSGIGGLDGCSLQRNDILSIMTEESSLTFSGKTIRFDDIPVYDHHHDVRILLGPQDDAFPSESISTLLSSTYRIGSASDRVGYRLEGPSIEHHTNADIISDATSFGTIQIPGDGMPIILFADRGTTGGYAKIGTVISADLGNLAQAAPGDTINFATVNVDVAYQSLESQRHVLIRISDSKPIMFGRREFSGFVSGKPFRALSPIKEIESSVTAPILSDHTVKVRAAEGGLPTDFTVHTRTIIESPGE
ncbi:MAG: biotin-dependent carboxyltransferase [SAR202 cluster bacterium]|nr:biotin-dependent carboxyltransferase [SAR202 cluster bacterium]|tara:strand:- start:788 stop:1933 length:1146 start_codon:yes stop_codon:yes gene_type:complete